MFALLPVVGGILAGWLAPRRAAVAIQVVLWAVAVAVLTATAPDHGGTHGDVVLFAPALAAVSLAALWIGFLLARRRTHAA